MLNKDISLAQQGSKSAIWTLAIETCYKRIINYEHSVHVTNVNFFLIMKSPSLIANTLDIAW
jgi:hypothetical protein